MNGTAVTRRLDDALRAAQIENDRLFDVTSSLDAGEARLPQNRPLVARYLELAHEIEWLQHQVWLRDGALAFSGMDLERMLDAAREALAYWTARHPRTLDYLIESVRCDSEIAAAERDIDRMQAAIYVRATTPRAALNGRAAAGDRRKQKSAARDGATPGVSRHEWIERKETTEPTLQGTYVERTYSGYAWRCDSCGLVWDKRHLASDCAARGHKPRFEERYGGRVENGVHVGYRAYTRAAFRRDKVAN